MLKSKYSGEPFDYKLYFLKSLKKIWLLPVAAIAGAVIIGGIYFLIKDVLGTGHVYQAKTMYYVTYAQNEDGQENDYYNYYTWEELMKTDSIVDGIVSEAGSKFDRQYVLDNVTATVESDYRYLYSTSDSTDKADALALENAVSKIILSLPEQKREIESIEIVKLPDESSLEDVSLIYEGHAAIVGAIIGLIACIIGSIFYDCFDSSVYLPGTLEKRYGITALGALCMKETAENCRYILTGKTRIALIAVDCKTAYDSVGEFIGQKASAEVICFNNPTEMPEKTDDIRKCDAVVLAVKAGAHDGKLVERTMEQLARQDIPVTAFWLANEDRWLISSYYGRENMGEI